MSVLFSVLLNHHKPENAQSQESGLSVHTGNFLKGEDNMKGVMV
jgi:hypothetical protein